MFFYYYYYLFIFALRRLVSVCSLLVRFRLVALKESRQ